MLSCIFDNFGEECRTERPPLQRNDLLHRSLNGLWIFFFFFANDFSCLPQESSEHQNTQHTKKMGNKICGGTSTKMEQPDEDARIQETLESLFPNFKPVSKGDSKWQKEEGVHCPECAHDFDFLTRRDHCRSCGKIFCSRCCYARKAIHDYHICGVCMGSAMKSLRERELSKLEVRVRTHSQLLRERERRNSQIVARDAAAAAGEGETGQEMTAVKGSSRPDEPYLPRGVGAEPDSEVSAEPSAGQQVAGDSSAPASHVA
jgi:hypothetical protein